MKKYAVLGIVEGELKLISTEALSSEEAFTILRSENKLQKGVLYHMIEVAESSKED